MFLSKISKNRARIDANENKSKFVSRHSANHVRSRGQEVRRRIRPVRTLRSLLNVSRTGWGKCINLLELRGFAPRLQQNNYAIGAAIGAHFISVVRAGR